MRRSCLLALLAGLLLLSGSSSHFARADDYADGLDSGDDAEEAADVDDVMVLTTDNFVDVVSEHKFVLVEFYAPWCGHCKNLAPEYSAAASLLKQKDPNIVLGKVDATVETALAKEYGIKGYPTIKWFVDGEPTEYAGPRERVGIVNWVVKKTGPVYVDVPDAAKLAELEQENEVVLLGHFKEPAGEEFDALVKLCQATEDVTCAVTVDAGVAAAADLKGHGFAAIKNFKGEPRSVSVHGASHAELGDFVQAEKLPLTIEFEQPNTEKIFGSGIPKQLFLWGSAADLDEKSPAMAAYKSVASKLKGKLVFVTVNNEGAGHKPVTNFFALTDAEPPAVVGFFMDETKKYRLKGEITEASLMEFAQGVLDGTAPQEFKSEPVPEQATDEDGVTTVVGKSVDDVVKDPTKDVLLEVYAPWCGHCKKLEPIYKKLGKRFKKIDSVVIAKMDGTQNEHADVAAQGYPALMLFPAAEGAEPIAFSGAERTLTALTKFIKEHARVPYELPKKEDAGGGGSDEL